MTWAYSSSLSPPSCCMLFKEATLSRTRLLPSRRRKRQGFTLVELLTAVLVLSVLMTIAMPLYLNAIDDSRKKTCRANMQTISNAAMAARVKSGASDFGPVITGGVTTATLPDLVTIPVCPNGGGYSFANGSSGTNTTFQVKCSATVPLAHGKFEPGLDHQ